MILPSPSFPLCVLATLRDTLRLPLTLALLLVLATASAAWSDDDPKRPDPRKYSDGPLTSEDFQAKPDPRSRFAAWSEIEFDFSLEYRFERKRGRVVMRLVECDVWAHLVRDKSWTRRPRDPLLLDHEQGHFDLAECHALAARIKIAGMIKTTAPALSVEADSEQAARTALEDALRELTKPFLTESRAANEKYDRETTNGTDAEAQANHRRQQRERLETLTKEWETLTNAKK
jgi:hypothetical protein